MVRDKIIYFLIIFLFVFESFNLVGLSVYRILILPLLVIGLFFLSNVNLQKKHFTILFSLFIFLVWTLLSGLNDGTFGNTLTNIIGIILLLIYLFKTFEKYSVNTEFINITCLAFSLYIVPYLVSYYFYYEGGRFSGIHVDPNFAGSYIILSMVGSNILIWNLFSRRFIFKIFKILLILFIFIDLYLITQTGSRGAFISSFLLLFLININYSNLFIKIIISVIFSLMIMNFLYLIENVKWNENLSGIELLAYRMSVIDESGSEFSRLKLFNDFLSVYKESFLYGMGGNNFVTKFGQFPHNLLIDILIEGGLIFGGIFIIYILKLSLMQVYVFFKTKRINLYFLLYLSGIIAFLSLSAFGLKLFWVFIFFLLITNINHNETTSKPSNSKLE